DVDGLRALLAEDAVFSMPPWAAWWRGRDTIAGFTEHAAEHCPETRSLPIRANAQVALASYELDEEPGRFLPIAIDVLTFEGWQISDITAFIMPELFPRFGLPSELDS